MVGLEQLKADITDQVVYYADPAQALIGPSYLHTVIYGPPGTGKTEVAKHLAGALCQVGALPSDSFKKLTRSDLVAGYLGQTAAKTQAAVEAALGGVLFIDEAYSLGSPDKLDSFAKECIDTLCDALSHYKDKLMVVVAGYASDLEACFFRYNPGLQSRFVWRHQTVAYVPADLATMFERRLDAAAVSTSMERAELDRWFANAGPKLTGYGRDVESLLSKVMIAAARRRFTTPGADRRLSRADLDSALEMFERHRGFAGSRKEAPSTMYL